MCCERGPAQRSHHTSRRPPSPAYPALNIGFVYMLIVCSSIGLAVHPVGRDVLDLIQSLNTTRADSMSGLRYTTGPNNNTPALLLEDTDRHIAVSSSLTSEALRLFLEHNEVTFLSTVRQEIGDSGTILAFASDTNRFIEIESSGRRDELRFHYTHQQQVRVETFPYRLADGLWHKLAVTVSSDQISVFVDCNRIYQRVIQSPDRAPSGALSLFIGQRNGQHALFRGALQDVKIVTQARGYLLQCTEQETDCPTCAKYQDLEQRVKEMSIMYKDLSLKLSTAEERLSGIEQCECLSYCHDNGTQRMEGQEWKKDKCNKCRCKNGAVECYKEECPSVACSNPVYRDGECCPICLTDCYSGGKNYDHGQSVSPSVCVTCICDNGRMVCHEQDTEKTCPKLDCPKSERIDIHGQCCPVCKGTDFCSEGHTCHSNASCINLATKYACQCHAGFEGDGHYCEDINECVTSGGRLGHHCNGNSVCVNTLGSYRCDCIKGHNRLDTYDCKGTQNSVSTPGQSVLLTALVVSYWLLTGGVRGQ